MAHPDNGDGGVAEPLDLSKPVRFRVVIGGIPTTLLVMDRREWEAIPRGERPDGFLSEDGNAVICPEDD